MAYSVNEVVEAFDRTMRAVARAERPPFDPANPWVSHNFDWLEDVHGWSRPVGDEMWVPLALTRERLSHLLTVLPDPEELQSANAALAAWPELRAMIADIDWDTLAPVPEPERPKWVPPVRADPDRVRAGHLAIANNGLSGIHPSLYGLELLGLWARHTIGIDEAVALIRKRQADDEPPAAIYQSLPKGSPEMEAARAWMRAEQADTTMLRLAGLATSRRLEP
jgi:hypothetical protein